MEEIKKKLLELIKEQTDMYAYNEVVAGNYSASELADILAQLVKYNEIEEENY